MRQQAAQLLSDKVTRELFRLAQAYGKQLPFRFEDLQQDLAHALAVEALQEVALKFVRPTERREVLAEYRYAFHAGAPRFHLDDAGGLAIVPLTPPFDLLFTAQFSLPVATIPGLRLNWTQAPTCARNRGGEYHDGNTTRRTGGRASKRLFTDDSLRSHGWIKWYRPERQYGFILDTRGSEVFFHASSLTGFEPLAGQAVTFVPLVTPKGVQAKDVRRG